RGSEKADRSILPAHPDAHTRPEQLQRVGDVVAALRCRALVEHRGGEFTDSRLRWRIELVAPTDEVDRERDEWQVVARRYDELRAVRQLDRRPRRHAQLGRAPRGGNRRAIEG